MTALCARRLRAQLVANRLLAGVKPCEGAASRRANKATSEIANKRNCKAQYKRGEVVAITQRLI
eukprot:7975-Heterococcus_DN1.PRE.2